MACLAFASASRADDALIFPGISCVFYGEQASDAYFTPTGSNNAIRNASTTTRPVVCPIIRPTGYAHGVEYAEVNVQGDVVCDLHVRARYGDSGIAYSRDSVYTGWGTNGRSYTWAAGAAKIPVNIWESYAFYCNVPPQGVILNYQVTVDN
jgi:hypothetical protein